MERWNLPSVACQAFGFVSEVSRYVRARGRDLRRRASLDLAKGPDFQKANYALQVLRQARFRATKRRQEWFGIWRM
jgi:hypothetical protein